MIKLLGTRKQKKGKTHKMKKTLMDILKKCKWLFVIIIVFVIAITNISCHNEPEGSTTGSIKSVTDDPKGDSGDEDDVEYSDEYFAAKYSTLRYPFDQ